MNARAPDPDRAVELLVELAQRSLTEEPPRRDAARFVAPSAHAAEPFRVARRPLLAAVGVSAAAAGVVLSLRWLAPPADPPLTAQVLGSEVAAGASVQASAAPAKLRFSDGSEISLDRGARARVAELRPRGSDVRLEAGKLHVRVAHRPRADWNVHAGPYTVRVTGTAFDVSWAEPARAFDLALREGSVTVTGPFAENGVRLVAGQRLTAGPNQQFVVTSLSRASQPEAPPATSEAKPEPPPRAATPDPAGALEPRGPSTWSRELSRGNFSAIIADAERRGLDSVCATANLEELGALADAARYARRVDVARRALLAGRERFPSSSRAREAAFFLGRLAEDQGDAAGALGWYERYLAGGRKGAYLAQALGRKMLIVHRQSGPDAARPIAREYQSRFPSGDYAATARKLASPE